MNEFEKDAEQYIINVAEGIDETVNALAGGDGKETISSRVGKMAQEGKEAGLILEPIVNAIMHNPHHCEEAIEPNVGGDAIIPD